MNYNCDADIYYYSDQWQVLEERENSSSTYDQYFTWGLRYLDDLIKRTGGRAHHYALADYFSITAIVNTSGTVIERYTYDAFGKPSYWSSTWSTRASSSYGWETLYASYRYDLESGMYRVRNRYLHPNLGRWISRDPLGEIGFEMVRNRPLSRLSNAANLYCYVTNNPTNEVDIEGLQSSKIGDAFFDCLYAYANPSSFARGTARCLNGCIQSYAADTSEDFLDCVASCVGLNIALEVICCMSIVAEHEAKPPFVEQVDCCAHKYCVCKTKESLTWNPISFLIGQCGCYADLISCLAEDK